MKKQNILNKEELELFYILEKSSKYNFGNSMGDCFLMTMCLTKYLKEKYDLQLTTHIGGIVNLSNKKDITVHLWSSLNGKKIDLTSFNQPVSNMNGSILDIPVISNVITGRLGTYKEMNSKWTRSIFQQWVDMLPKDIINTSQLLLKYGKKGIVPNSVMEKSIQQYNRMGHYRDFYNYMEMDNYNG